MLSNLTLKGAMAKQFGKNHQYDVQNLKELLRALCATIKGFEKYMCSAHLKGIKFAFFVDGKNIGIDEFDINANGKNYMIMPVTQGAKSGGMFQIIIGAVALVAAFFTAGATLAQWGTLLTASTMSATSILTGIGISMMLGGVVQLLTPQPKFNAGKSSSAENKPNYGFGGPVNTNAVGYPVPVLLGEREIGGAVINAGIYSEDQQ
ncbi:MULTISPECIES: tail assembly protein [unclassified Gilliamella]|uniref:tail assembly protein n=1 Tax=unclassified Gilliamella TaxID=2685620 RepID=UPI00080DBE13|nr:MULTISPECIES: tail assembly protein [Gilliamella]MCX8642947.1 tail assembly protein [Gilliamella sp. B3835]MCX8708281.1 tail assembly protein [Gilliamella sp. B3783]MCX8709428.1 tail assembly protein [Gilliamella sp. B3780]MCX8714222.1 tail assembly protein [Gilliamella sp. B3781]MCX8717534.1 tail assembly protein [Gilliamella sp. B3784]